MLRLTRPLVTTLVVVPLPSRLLSGR